mgnify:CR=1 FL=1
MFQVRAVPCYDVTVFLLKARALVRRLSDHDLASQCCRTILMHRVWKVVLCFRIRVQVPKRRVVFVPCRLGAYMPCSIPQVLLDTVS